jgi:hypothetical protein
VARVTTNHARGLPICRGCGKPIQPAESVIRHGDQMLHVECSAFMPRAELPGEKPSTEHLAAVRQRVGVALGQGALPRVRAAMVWSGPGMGFSCAACGATISANQLEFELEFEELGVAKTYRFHRHCHDIWFDAVWAATTAE